DGGFDQVVGEVAAVVGALTVGDLDDETAGVGQHERDGVLAGDQVGEDGPFPQDADLVHVELPERGGPFAERGAAPDVVDEQVETAGVGANPVDEGGDLVGLGVVTGHRDAFAAGLGDQVGGVLDGLRAVHVGAVAASGAAGDVDGGAGGAEFDGDTP